MIDNTDLNLFHQLRSGNKDAFNTLFRKYYEPLCRFAVFFTQNPDLAEDAVQTAYIAFWEGRTQIEITHSVKAYLYQMVRNNALILMRKDNTRKIYESNFTELKDEEIAENPITDDELKKLIQKGVNNLPEKCRIIFSLSRNDGLTYEEIAEYLDISPKTVENQMGIAFQKLREFLLPIWRKALVFLGVLFLGNIS